MALDDALNLGWKLAAAVRGRPGLLDSYHSERHDAGARVLANTQAQVQLGELAGPLRDLLTRVARHPAGNVALTEVITGLDTRYAMVPASDHPWVGRLAPNLTVQTATGPTDLCTLLTPGRPVLITAEATTRSGVDHVVGTFPGHPDLRAVLIRPDGHVAWIQTGPDADGLDEATAHWFREECP